MNEGTNAMMDVLVLIILLAIASQFLVKSYSVIDKKVDMDVRDDKTAIRNYTGNVLDSNPDFTYEYTSQDILLMSAIQDRHNPSNRVITVSNNKRFNFRDGASPMYVNMIFDTGYSGLDLSLGTEDMTGDSYLNGDRKSFIQEVWLNNSTVGFKYNYEQHKYIRISNPASTTLTGIQVRGFRNLLDFSSSPNKRWNLYLVKDTKIPGFNVTGTEGGNYVWCVIQPQ